MTKHILIILIVVLFVSKLNAQSIKKTNWLLLSIDNLKTNEHKIADKFWGASLHFDSDSSYGGGSGCNSYNGYFKSSADSILVMNNPIRTKIGCASLGEELYDIYPKANYYKIQRDTLFLFTSDNYRVTFKKQ